MNGPFYPFRTDLIQIQRLSYQYQLVNEIKFVPNYSSIPNFSLKLICLLLSAGYWNRVKMIRCSHIEKNVSEHKISLKFKFSYFSERQLEVQRVRQGGSQGDGPPH